MKVPFTKTHGQKNDFLLTPAAGAPESDPAEFAKAICDRHSGIGADGWYLVSPGDAECAAAVRLINSDGSGSEVSGNGTRCVAAYLLQNGLEADRITIRTGAGLKSMRVLERRGSEWYFEMNMGCVYYPGEVQQQLPLASTRVDATVLNVGNPQCAVFVDNFDFDWRSMGAAIEWHEWFPQRTNVSFVHALDRHTIEVRIWERGAGETLSSGTGSTGAAFAALTRGLVDSPVRVLTPAGPLDLRLEGEELMLTGPAAVIGSGEFDWEADVNE